MLYTLVVENIETSGVLFNLTFDALPEAVLHARLVWIHLAPEWKLKARISLIEVKKLEPADFGNIILDIFADNPVE